MSNYSETIDFIKNQFPNKDFIPLHEPSFSGREKEYVLDTIESTFVSSILFLPFTSSFGCDWYFSKSADLVFGISVLSAEIDGDDICCVWFFIILLLIL